MGRIEKAVKIFDRETIQLKSDTTGYIEPTEIFDYDDIEVTINKYVGCAAACGEDDSLRLINFLDMWTYKNDDEGAGFDYSIEVKANSKNEKIEDLVYNLLKERKEKNKKKITFEDLLAVEKEILENADYDYTIFPVIEDEEIVGGTLNEQ